MESAPQPDDFLKLPQLVTLYSHGTHFIRERACSVQAVMLAAACHFHRLLIHQCWGIWQLCFFELLLVA